MSQQITVASEVTFGSLIPAFAENGTILFIFMLSMGILAFICAKFRLSKWAYFGIAILICLLAFGWIWASIHLLVYGASQTALLNTLIFGILGTLLTLLFGSFIPWFCFHLANNMFLLLSKLVTLKSDVAFITIIVLSIIFLIWIGVIFYRLKHKIKDSEYSIPNA